MTRAGRYTVGLLSIPAFEDTICKSVEGLKADLIYLTSRIVPAAAVWLQEKSTSTCPMRRMQSAGGSIEECEWFHLPTVQFSCQSTCRVIHETSHGKDKRGRMGWVQPVPTR